jgi:hypothetical protein
MGLLAFQMSMLTRLLRYWGDAKAWSNRLESGNRTSFLARDNEVYRVLKPRHLCFLRDPYDDELHGVDVRSVAEWEQTDGLGINLSYLFIAYSTAHFSHDSDEDKMALHYIAETAARAAKVPAYWVAVSCMRDPAELEADVSLGHPSQIFRKRTVVSNKRHS